MKLDWFLIVVPSDRVEHVKSKIRNMIAGGNKEPLRYLMCYFNVTGVGICQNKKKLRLKFARRAGKPTWTSTKLVLFTPASNNWLLEGKINRPFPAFISSPESLWRLYLPTVMDSCPAVNDIVLSSGVVKANTESATFSRAFTEIFTNSLPCRNCRKQTYNVRKLWIFASLKQTNKQTNHKRSKI